MSFLLFLITELKKLYLFVISLIIDFKFWFSTFLMFNLLLTVFLFNFISTLDIFWLFAFVLLLFNLFLFLFSKKISSDAFLIFDRVIEFYFKRSFNSLSFPKLIFLLLIFLSWFSSFLVIYLKFDWLNVKILSSFGAILFLLIV